MEEPVKRPRGRPKREKPAEETPVEKKPRGRPKKASAEKPAEETPTRRRGRPKKEPAKALVTETAPPKEETPAVVYYDTEEEEELERQREVKKRYEEARRFTPQFVQRDEPPDPYAGLPKDVKNERKVSEMVAFKRGYEEANLPAMTDDQEAEAEGEFVEAQEEDPETDPFPFWEEVATKYGVRNPLPIPVPEERPTMKMKRRYAIRERYTKDREQGRRVALSGKTFSMWNK